MPAPFNDILLQLPTGQMAGTPAYQQEICQQSYITDLYGRCMNGYKPPFCSRIIIQPHYYGIWNQPRKTGSIIAIAPFFDRNAFDRLDKHGQYRQLLHLIQECMLQLSETFHWNREVFENTYQQVLDKNFLYNFDYPSTLSKNRKMSAFLNIEKTERVTTVYASIVSANETVKIKLYDKTNSFWYDCSYVLARHTKWFDAERFGIHYPKANISLWYSMGDKTVSCLQDGQQVHRIDFRKSFWMQAH